MRAAVTLAPPLGTMIARLLLVVFAVVHVVLAVGPGPTSPVLTALALLTVIAAAATVVLVPGEALGLAPSAVVVVLTMTSVALIVPSLPGHGWPGYASWPLGAVTFITIALALRQRIGAAWLAMAAMSALCLTWGIRSGEGVLAGVGLIDRQIGVLVIGTLFAVGLRRAARAADGFRAVQQRTMLERGVAEAELQARGDAVRRVLADVGPTLHRIAAGERFDAVERGRIIALEGRLRDEITLGPLRSEPLERSLAAARARGMDVVVLTGPDIAEPPASLRAEAAEWIASRLDSARGSAFVARVVLLDGGMRVSTTIDGDHEDLLRIPVPGP